MTCPECGWEFNRDCPACLKEAEETEQRQRLQQLIDMGYTEEELERDNPHNAWMRDVKL